jgi:hypothetical protein
MSDLMASPAVRSEALRQERRSDLDRRRGGQDRRTVDLWQQVGRLGLELRTGTDRRSGFDRRGGHRHRIAKAMDFVTPWQIPEEQDPGARE